MWSLGKRNKIKKIMWNLERSHLSSLSTVVSDLLSLIHDPKTDAADVARICENDLALSTRLLRAANSVYFGKRINQQVDNIREAISRLGFRKTEEIIMSMMISGFLKNAFEVADYSSHNLWRHSIAVGISNRLIVAAKFEHMVADAYMAGLLHDLGIALMQEFVSDDGFKKALSQRKDNDSVLIDEERSILGYTHEDLGRTAAEMWNFPPHLCEVIGQHHSMKTKNQEVLNLIHVNRVSEYLVNMLDLGYSDFSESYTRTLEESGFLLDLDVVLYQEIINKLKREINALVRIGLYPQYRLKWD